MGSISFDLKMKVLRDYSGDLIMCVWNSLIERFVLLGELFDLRTNMLYDSG